jgi:hypothetical protein
MIFYYRWRKIQQLGLASEYKNEQSPINLAKTFIRPDISSTGGSGKLFRGRFHVRKTRKFET